ncbi:MAG: hypothetical protein LBU14_05645 [Candidatus Peribacteria bacterium]|nr:hypothetical protein [Candidatus Peribacteria bacterium]
MIVKKKFRPDFKKIVLDEKLNNEEKIALMNDEYRNIFEQIEDIFNLIPISSILLSSQEEEENKLNNLGNDEINLKNKLKKIVELGKNRVDLYFDAMKPLHSKHNQNIITFLKALKYLNLPEYKDLQTELENSIKTGMKYLAEKTKEL